MLLQQLKFSAFTARRSCFCCHPVRALREHVKEPAARFLSGAQQLESGKQNRPGIKKASDEWPAFAKATARQATGKTSSRFLVVSKTCRDSLGMAIKNKKPAEESAGFLFCG